MKKGISVETVGRRIKRDLFSTYLSIGGRHRVIDKEDMVSDIRGAKSFAFACTGNICRSPFAEHYMRATTHEDIEVTSFGFRAGENQRSPDTATQVARDRGVDISEHRSRPAPDNGTEMYDVVFIMDLINLQDANMDFDYSFDNMYLLGAVGDDSGVEIQDPNGLGSETYENVYSHIENLIDRVVREVN